jgi:MFS family permease
VPGAEVRTGAASDARWLLAARGARAFGDGFVAVLLPIHLVELGLGSFEIGLVLAGAVVGSASLTLAVGRYANRFSRRGMLAFGCLLMVLTGAGFASATAFWPLLIVAFIGTMSPSGGDSGLFVPLEQTALSQIVAAEKRTALFAGYSLVGTLAGALGTLAAAAPGLAAGSLGLSREAGAQAMFALYGLLGIAALGLYRPLSQRIEAPGERRAAPLRQSRGIVWRLAALFSLDSFGGGFAAQSIVALWLYRGFHVSAASTSAILFMANICSALSYVAAVPIAKRLGLINTMVFTHLPSNLFLALVPFAPSVPIAIGLLLARYALSQMDVPTRTSYVMAVVAPEERPAAVSLTAVPRSFTAAIGPAVAGYMLALSSFGWPLVAAGSVKAVYDLLLLVNFRHVRPPEEAGRPTGAP